MTAQRDPIAIEWVPADTFGARLALIRQHLGGFNVARAARLCGLDDQSWRNWEAGSGCQGYETVCRKIAQATGCSQAWLMAGGPLDQNRKKMIRADLRVVDGGAEGTSPRLGVLRPV